MAEGSRLVLEFLTAEEKTVTFSFKYAKPSATSTQVKNLMQSMITNKNAFETPPIEMKSAKIVTTSETVFDLYANERVGYYEALKRGLIAPEPETDLEAYEEYLKKSDKNS